MCEVCKSIESELNDPRVIKISKKAELEAEIDFDRIVNGTDFDEDLNPNSHYTFAYLSRMNELTNEFMQVVENLGDQFECSDCDAECFEEVESCIDCDCTECECSDD